MELKISKRPYPPHQKLIQHPSEIGYFSIDCHKQLHLDRSQMKYYVPKSRHEFPLDLNANYGKDIIPEFDPKERLHQVLKWIQLQKPGILDDFITVRGTMQDILCTPYMRKTDEWCICATKFSDTIYFHEIPTEMKRIRDANPTEREKQLCCWGYKFEQYMVSDTPDGVPDISSTTFQAEQFSLMMSNTLGKHSVLLKAELDCVDSDFSGYGDATGKYIELKTSKKIFPHDVYFQKHKSLKWWAQCHLAGVQKIICGIRDDYGKVYSVEEYKTSHLPAIGKAYWKPNVCYNFCKDFLEFLKKTVIEDNYRIVYKLNYTGGDDSVTCTRMIDPEPQYRIIPDWFV